MLIGEKRRKRNLKLGRIPAPMNAVVVAIVLRPKAVDCRSFQVGRNEGSIFGVNVGICALHDGRGVQVVPVQKGSEQERRVKRQM